jgi:hypothetical protein
MTMPLVEVSSTVDPITMPPAAHWPDWETSFAVAHWPTL